MFGVVIQARHVDEVDLGSDDRDRTEGEVLPERSDRWGMEPYRAAASRACAARAHARGVRWLDNDVPRSSEPQGASGATDSVAAPRLSAAPESPMSPRPPVCPLPSKARRPSLARPRRLLTAPPRPTILASMNEYEIASLAASQMAAWASVVISAFIAYLMLCGIREMTRLNDTRAAQADTAQRAMEGMLTALERQGKALEEVVRRMSPHSAPARSLGPG